MTPKEIADRLLAEVEINMSEQAGKLVASKLVHARWTVQVLSPLVVRMIQDAVKDAVKEARKP